MAPPSAPPPNGKSSPAARTVPNSSTPIPQKPDNRHDQIDETPDFGSNWHGLGIGRLLVLALVLALFISAGLWMLEAQFKKQQEAASPSPAFAVATAICGLETRASEGQPKTEGADQALILKGADQAFERRFAEGFIQQSCLVRDLHQKAEQLEEKIKEAEEKRDKAREQLEARLEPPPSPVPSQIQGNEVKPETKPESERERLKATVQEQQSLMLTLSAERQRIDADKIAAEQTLNERLKEQKLARGFEPQQEKSASGNDIDKPSAQLPANPAPLANAKKSVALKCSDILMRLQLGESSQSDLDALRQCALR